MQFYRLFTHKTNTLDIKSNCFICTVSSFTRRLFSVLSVSQLHRAQIVTAAKPCSQHPSVRLQKRARCGHSGSTAHASTDFENHSVLKAKFCSHLPKGASKWDCV